MSGDIECNKQRNVSDNFMQFLNDNPPLGSLACKGINKIYT